MNGPANGVLVPATGPTERAGFSDNLHERIEQLVGNGYQAVPLDGVGVTYIAPPAGTGALNPRATELIARHGTRLHPPIIVAGPAVITGRTRPSGEPGPLPFRILAEIDQLPDPEDSQLAELRCHALRYGWAITTSTGPTGKPVASTVGLTAHGHAELVFTGTGIEQARRLLNMIAAVLVTGAAHGPPDGIRIVDVDPGIYDQSWWQPVRRYHQLWTPNRVDAAVAVIAVPAAGDGNGPIAQTA